nr:NAD(P)-dependent oxidoreductase [uncultured Carboxylicivirga sp.]
MKRILITGGSGFIGTNLISELNKQENLTILNLDLIAPKIESQNFLWKRLDIRDKNDLELSVKDFNPNVVIHLAARTDLNGETLQDYNSNIIGVSNLLEVLDELNDLKRVIFTSSMYVCEPGYMPENEDDYKPHTLYGESKVQTEKLIKSFKPNNYTWCIIRPTSIWGPWFGEPYANFFNVVISKRYFHFGDKACSKTYGYVSNTIYQILSVIKAKDDKIDKQLFYLGDWPEYNISEWADEIAEYLGMKIPEYPFFIIKMAAFVGDLLKLFGIKFPMTSFRLKNMTTNNVFDLEAIRGIVANLPKTRKEGIKQTIEWINSQKNS